MRQASSIGNIPLDFQKHGAPVWTPHAFVFLLFFLLSHPKYFIAKCSHTDAHQRTDKIEDAIWQVSKCWHAEHRALRHTTGVPRNEHRGDGHTVFRCAAQQAAFIALTVVYTLEHIAR